MRTFFSKFACLAAMGLGSAYGFLIALLGVIFWAFTGPFFGFSETWQLVINTSTTIITFLSVFLIQNSQNRESKAMQLKLDELIRTLDKARNEMIDVEDRSEEELEKLGLQFKDLCKQEGESACEEKLAEKGTKDKTKEINPTAIETHSLDWMPKAVWGPIKWRELHCRALTNLPMEKEKQWFEQFLKGLPCPKCRNHFGKFLEDKPPQFGRREDFFAWTIDAHNYVNQELGKPLVSLEDAKDIYRCEEDSMDEK